MRGSFYSESPWRINTVFERKARKFHQCEECGSDIIPGDLYWEYKPLPIRLIGGKFKAAKWRKRCWDHKPKYYDEANVYQEGHMLIPTFVYRR